MLKIIQNIEEAKATLLKRLTPGQERIPLALRDKIKEVFGADLSPEEVVRKIINEVQSRGDEAIRDYSKALDGIALQQLEVPPDAMIEAYRRVDNEVLSALELAAERIRAFHLRQKYEPWMDFTEGGLGQIVQPLEKVGIYAPGGTACYPSTVLMTAIPARVAGVKEIILSTPPQPGGTVNPLMLAAAYIAQVDRVFVIGGAQAVAAMAFGTSSVPKVDKICGPGNIFVMLAKKIVYGTVDIEGLMGPTETMIVADDSANPSLCAADLLAQAEHDAMASAILVTPSLALAQRVNEAVERQLAMLNRRDIAASSLENRGGIIVVSDLDEAIDLVNFYAPEHLCLMVEDAWSQSRKVKNAGGIFIGENSPEALGDYVAGPSHVMPTGGTARFRSTLHVGDFLKTTSVIALNEATLNTVGPAAAILARAEGLTAHAKALEMRLSSSSPQRS